MTALRAGGLKGYIALERIIIIYQPGLKAVHPGWTFHHTCIMDERPIAFSMMIGQACIKSKGLYTIIHD